MDRVLEMMRELVNHFELQARRASQCQIQQQFIKESPYQQDSYSPYHPNCHSQTQPYLYPSFHNSFQPPHYNNHPYSTENVPNFFHHADVEPNFQTPSYDCPLYFQNQEQPFYPQPHAQTEHSYYSQPYEHREFQQENQFFDFHEPQLSQMPTAVLKQEVERQSEVAADSVILSHGAGTFWSYQDEGVEDKQKEEEKAFTWVDEAETRAWELSQALVRWENGANEGQFRGEEESRQEEAEQELDLHLNAPGLLQQEEGKEGQDNELKEEEEKVDEDDSNSYPKFRIGDRVIPYDQYREEEEEKMMEDSNSYPMFRRGEEIFAYSPHEVELFLRSVKDNYGEGGGVELDKDELELSILQPEVEQKAQQKVVEEDRIAATMKSLAELDIPFPAALNRTQQQKEEEAKKRKLEEKKLLSLLLTRKKEGEKENTLEEDEYFSLLFRKEEEANACGVHQKKRRKKRRKKKKKKLEGVQHTLLKLNEEATIEEGISSDLDFLIQEVQTLFQHGFSFKGEGEKEESLQISPSSPNLHQLEDKEFTSTNSDFLLQEAYSITTVQTNEEKLEEEEGKKKLDTLLVKEEEAEQLTELLNSALEIHNEQQQAANAEEVVQLEVQYKLLQQEGEAEELEFLQAPQSKYKQQLEQEEKVKEDKKLAVLELPLLLIEGEEDIAALTCEDLDTLLYEVPHLLQPSSSSKEKGEQPSPYSLQLHRIKEKCVEDFTSSDFDFLLLEEHSTTTGQHLFKEEKKQEDEKEEAIAPDLQKREAAELQRPQATTPRRKEAAEYPFNFPSFSSEFELTINQFLLSLKLFISGDRLQEQQLPLQVIYKLHLIVLLGEVHKKGTKGDGVPWFIKVHPP